MCVCVGGGGDARAIARELPPDHATAKTTEKVTKGCETDSNWLRKYTLFSFRGGSLLMK